MTIQRRLLDALRTWDLPALAAYVEGLEPSDLRMRKLDGQVPGDRVLLCGPGVTTALRRLKAGAWSEPDVALLFDELLELEVEDLALDD